MVKLTGHMSNKGKNSSETALLDLMIKLCHCIAFETTAATAPYSDGSGILTASPEKDGKEPLDPESKEQIANKLYALTDSGKAPKKIASLAESFGLMLVKLDVREMKQERLINELKERNKALEIAKRKLGEQNRSLVGSLREKYSPAQFVGQCPEMQKVTQMALSIAHRPINTLILGASGTGKEVFAKIIHFNSPRADKTFLAVNCTAIPESLFESEMFGIEKGVATGVSRRAGFFEQAHTGTLFLDEIGDMSLSNQAKLLRVLEEREVMRVGGSTPVKVDVNIISATNMDLKEAVAAGKFREDLYYRLNVVELVLPLLKDRGEDIVILAEKLLAKNCQNLGRSPISLSEGARKCLLAYDWPGNVRELNNEMERAAALTLSEIVEVEDLSAKLTPLSLPDTEDGAADSSGGAAEPVRYDELNYNLEAIEKQVVYKALEQSGGNKTKAAELLGITREGLRKKLMRF